MLVLEMQTKAFLQAVFFFFGRNFFQEMALIGREVGKSTCLAVYGRSGGGGVSPENVKCSEVTLGDFSNHDTLEGRLGCTTPEKLGNL